MQVISISRRATTTPAEVWSLFADVPARTRWDDAIEHIAIAGSFTVGATGTVKLKGQPARRFSIIECDPPRRYTDRFFLPAGGRMDWVHTLTEVDGGCEVTFAVHVSGPSALILRPILKRILGRALPPTVDKLLALAASG